MRGCEAAVRRCRLQQTSLWDQTVICIMILERCLTAVFPADSPGLAWIRLQIEP